MKLHYSRVELNAWGGHTTGSWCRRTNARCTDGMNLTSDPKTVTCKFCLKIMAPRGKSVPPKGVDHE
jgi:hypothetical protein